MGVATLSDEARAALEAGHLAHLVTLNEDGSPHVTLVWVGLEGEDIVSGHLGSWKKLHQNVGPRSESDPLNGNRRSQPAAADAEYLVIDGAARVTEGGAPALLQRLAHIYLGPDVRFPPMDDPPDGFVLRITPVRVGGVGPWAA